MTTTNFIEIQGSRIRKTGIKTYCPVGELSIKITYNFSRNRPESQIFKFDSKNKRDEELNTIDQIL